MFFRFNHNLKVPVSSGTIFACMEDFTERYTNVAISGPHYEMFVPRKTAIPPYTLNTRIYSCILIRNDIPYRWRGRYNEDTDLSIRALKDGWCTILFTAFLSKKITTMLMKGGNTDELYKGDGRRRMAESLRDQHPDITTITWKWNRWQHQVDYSDFKKNKLVRRPDYVEIDQVNNYGMELVVLSGREAMQQYEQEQRDVAGCQPITEEGEHGTQDEYHTADGFLAAESDSSVS
jgi:hypothetical protein